MQPPSASAVEGEISLTATDRMVQENFTAHFPAGRFPANRYAQYEQSQQDLLGELEESLILTRR